ncbi:hypothetical protein K437DRAFT_268064 [Tilletiaria anomala UBC 951]|uniref:DH domain-containing protein n=1 Tax=Tilletiaria anomala (strain ATCC 24038 / CBS 436.72 / UBC 951) TaxID=1037660 RepID=A0A066VYP6_TILAU|nr:uncharacterized protein K437DRAFT_268064 [Tilletiaria anomala UBC 951]KDN46626.1 hypothetical protein K437DRAFT_268064 [Tilletiaria anomala UBC 951]
MVIKNTDANRPTSAPLSPATLPEGIPRLANNRSIDQELPLSLSNIPSASTTTLSIPSFSSSSTRLAGAAHHRQSLSSQPTLSGAPGTFSDDPVASVSRSSTGEGKEREISARKALSPDTGSVGPATQHSHHSSFASALDFTVQQGSSPNPSDSGRLTGRGTPSAHLTQVSGQSEDIPEGLDARKSAYFDSVPVAALSSKGATSSQTGDQRVLLPHVETLGHVETSSGFESIKRRRAKHRRTKSEPSAPRNSTSGNEAYVHAGTEFVLQAGFVPLLESSSTNQAASLAPTVLPLQASGLMCLPCFATSPKEDRGQLLQARQVTQSKYQSRPLLVRSGAILGSSSALGLSFPGSESAPRPDELPSPHKASHAPDSSIAIGAATVERVPSDISSGSRRSHSTTGTDTSSRTGPSSSSALSTSRASRTTASSSLPTPTSSDLTTPDNYLWSSNASPFAFASSFVAKLTDNSDLPSPPPAASIPATKHSPRSATLTLLDKQVQQRLRLYHALIELVETERSYADDLAILVLVFLENLQRMPFFGQAGDAAERNWKVETVSRNAEQILRLHQQIAVHLETIVARHGLKLSNGATPGEHPATTEEEIQKAMSQELDVAVVHVARYFVSVAPMLALYQTYCAKHSEALGLIHEAEKRQADWQAFEAHCTDIIRWQTEAKAKRMSRSRHSSSNNVNLVQSQPPSSPTSPDKHVQPPESAASNTTNLSSKSATNQASGRSRSPSASQLLLHFHDFFVKPVQRIVLYRLVLSTLVKHATGMDLLRTELEEALDAVKVAADRVDDAGKKREQELLAEMLLWRLASHYSIAQNSLRALGPVWLAGPLHALYHHSDLAPLEAPLRFKYYGVVLCNGWILLAKVRKSGVYEARHFFPLWAAKLTTRNDDLEAVIPQSFRISVRGHHFEMMACSSKEKELWTSTIGSAIKSAPCSPPGDAASFPSSLPMDDLNMAGVSEVHTPSEMPKIASDPLSLFLSTAISAGEASSAPAACGNFNTSAAKAGRPVPVLFNSTTNSIPPAPVAISSASEVLIRTNTPAQCLAVDRCMIMSALCIAAHSPSHPSRDVVTTNPTSQWLATSAPGLGATVGAAIGLSRLANNSNPGTVRLQRRKSMVEMSAVAPSPKMRVLDVPGRSALTTPGAETEERGPLEGWKNTFRKRTLRTRPASVIGVAIDSPSREASSLPVSAITTPVLEMKEFPITEELQEFEKVNPVAPPAAATCLRRTQSRSFACNVRNVFATSIGARPRASTLFQQGQDAQAVIIQTSHSLDMHKISGTEAGPVFSEFGATVNRAADETTRPRSKSLKRALSFRRSSGSSSASSGPSSGTPPFEMSKVLAGSEALRTIRARASRHFAKVDMSFTGSLQSSTTNSAEHDSSEGMRPAPAMQRATTEEPASAQASFTHRKRLNRIFLQTNRFSPLPMGIGRQANGPTATPVSNGTP